VHRREAVRAHRSLDELSERDPRPMVVPDSADRAYEVWAVREAIDELPADEREVVRLQHLGGLTHTQVADRLGIPVGMGP